MTDAVSPPIGADDVDAPNPLLERSPLPYELPDYARIRPAHYLPAFETAFAEQLAEVAAITADTATPTFENTVLALERSGGMLARVAATFYTVASADGTDEIQRVEELLAPRMAAHTDAVQLDPDLYRRISDVHDRLDELGLDAESRYLVERRFRSMTRAGAGLDQRDKQRVSSINRELSTLTTAFEKHLLADTNELAVVFDDAAELDGLSEGELSAAARAAADRGLPGRYVVTLTLFTMHPYLASMTVRASREKLLTASRSRGSRGNAFDNRGVLLDIVRLRAERAGILGYPSHAAFVTADQTAGSPEAVAGMLRRLAVPAARNARAERDALQAMIDDEPETFELAAHDWALYTERVRADRYDIDRHFSMFISYMMFCELACTYSALSLIVAFPYTADTGKGKAGGSGSV